MMSIYYSENKALDGVSQMSPAVGKVSATVPPTAANVHEAGVMWVDTAAPNVYLSEGGGNWWRIGDFGAL